MAKKKTITKGQLKAYINSLKEYRDNELKDYIESLQSSLITMLVSSNPPSPPPPPPVLR